MVAATAAKGIFWLKGPLAALWRSVLATPLRRIAGFFVFVIGLPLYKIYSIGRRFLTKRVLWSGSAWWDIVTHRYVTHGIIIIIGVLVVANNIQARVNGFRDEDFGKQSILYEVAGQSDDEYIEETFNDVITAQPTTYSGYLGVGQTTGGFTAPAVTTDTATTQGGTALVKTDVSPVTPAGQVSTRSSEETYQVQLGDTLGSIAEKFGISIYTILWENSLTERSTIRPGDNLSILPADGVKHKIKRGETLGYIAKLYNVDAQVIITFNDLIDENGLQIGQDLIIPGGKKIPIYVPTKSAPAPRSYVGAPPPSASNLATGTRLLWPTTTRRITQYFGWRHTGVDIASRESPPIYAAEAGTVIDARPSGWNGGYGNMIIIDHGGGLQTLYGHNSTLYVSKGDVVSRGQTIAIMGNTGRSTGPHVHFEVRVNGKRVNPLSYTK